jgi:adenylylsulfate kinase-like enzyme
MVRRVVILVQGRTCSGKSTLVGVLSKALADNVKNLYVLPYDLIKTGLMGYHRDKHAPLVKQLAVGISEVMFNKQLSVLVDMNFGSKYEYDRYIRTARRYRYEVVPINLVAPRNVLLERFRRRIRAFREQGINTSGMDERRYLKALTKNGYLAKHSHSFDTSEKSVDEISREVIEILRSVIRAK